MPSAVLAAGSCVIAEFVFKAPRAVLLLAAPELLKCSLVLCVNSGHTSSVGGAGQFSVCLTSSLLGHIKFFV